MQETFRPTPLDAKWRKNTEGADPEIDIATFEAQLKRGVEFLPKAQADRLRRQLASIKEEKQEGDQ